MKRAVITLGWLLLSAGQAAAEGPLGAGAGDAVASAARGVKASADEVAERASESVGDAAGEAKRKTREAATAIGHGARSLAHDLAESTKDGVALLGEQASEWLESGATVAAAALERTREEAREVLITVADKLDAKGREERSEARRARWQRLKERHQLRGERPSPALSDELRDHDYRVARLKRAQELAIEADDAKAAARSRRLLELEETRHERRLSELRAVAPRPAERRDRPAERRR